MAGIVVDKQELLTRNNDKMAFVTIEDLDGTFELVVFPNLFSEVRFLLVENKVLLIAGQVSLRDDQIPNILANQIVELEIEQNTLPTKMQNYLDNNRFSQNNFNNHNYQQQTTAEDQTETETRSARHATPTMTNNDLTLGIKWDQDLKSEASLSLLSMLEYFSGDTPVYLFEMSTKQILNLEQPLFFEMEYLEQLTKRYGTERFMLL